MLGWTDAFTLLARNPGSPGEKKKRFVSDRKVPEREAAD